MHRGQACSGLGLLYTSNNKRFYTNMLGPKPKHLFLSLGRQQWTNIAAIFKYFPWIQLQLGRCCNCGHEVTYWSTHGAGLFCFARGGESWNCYLYHCGPAQSVLPDLPGSQKLRLGFNWNIEHRLLLLGTCSIYRFLFNFPKILALFAIFWKYYIYIYTLYVDILFVIFDCVVQWSVEESLSFEYEY